MRRAVGESTAASTPHPTTSSDSHTHSNSSTAAAAASNTTIILSSSTGTTCTTCTTSTRTHHPSRHPYAFARSVAALPDLDGDGLPELAVGGLGDSSAGGVCRAPSLGVRVRHGVAAASSKAHSVTFGTRGPRRRPCGCCVSMRMRA